MENAFSKNLEDGVVCIRSNGEKQGKLKSVHTILVHTIYHIEFSDQCYVRTKTKAAQLLVPSP